MNAARLFAVVGFALLTACGGVSVLPEPFTRERADGKIPVSVDLIRQQVRAELSGTPEGEAEVARWQTIETDYNQCRLSSARATKSEAEEVFSVCMSERGYVYMFPIDAEQFHNDIAFEEEKAYPERLAAERKAEEERIAAEKKAAEEAECRQKGEQYNGALLAAAEVGNVELVRKWLSLCANPNAVDTSLSIYSGETVLAKAARTGHAEIVELLLLAGANPNAGFDGGSPLSWAASWGYAEVVKMLLSAGANPNAATDGGETALIEAAREGHAEIIRILLSAGANKYATDILGHTAMDKAKILRHSEIVRMLEEAGAR